MTEKKTLLMLGDSLVEWGDWETLLPDLRVISRGRAGELCEGLSARLFDELERTPEPDFILLMSGTNNLLSGSPQFTAMFQTMLPRLRLCCGDSAVLVCSVLPMTAPGLSKESVAAVNQELRAAAEASGCRFIDMTAPFAEQCLPITRPCFLSDGVHLSTLGYQVWAKEIRSCCLG